IRTPLDNERLADLITEQVREITSDEDCALHVSIAGGRKTMGFYLGYALSLFGRPQDRLSHVLVSEPYESSWHFFYPTPGSNVINTHDNKLVDARDARVELAEIPFVRLRDGLDERLLEGAASFSETVALAQRALEPPRLVIDLEHQCILVAGERIELPPKQLALLSLFAERLLEGREPLTAPAKSAPDMEWGREFLRHYRAVRNGDLDDIERTEKALRKGMDGEYFSETKSKLHRILKKRLGAAAIPYLIDDGGTRPRRYALRLPKQSVHFGKLAGE
ncbi:TIGR02584 family CRISPR-associated protein, partial [Candidatus Parcubacteria bacterium]